MPTTVEEEVSCPKCGGRTWDNRLTKKNPKAPDYKCRDKGCDGCVWPPKGAAAAPRASSNRQPISHGSPGPFDEQESDEATFVKKVNAPATPSSSAEWLKIRETYVDTLQWVLDSIEPILSRYDTPETKDVLAATATLFIERNKRGC